VNASKDMGARSVNMCTAGIFSRMTPRFVPLMDCVLNLRIVAV